MSKDKIKEVAVQHFNRYGYYGVKMAQIANDAGIRKQSLSYHFPSKIALFTEIYGEVVDEEISFVRNFFAANQQSAWDERLYQFLVEHKNRFITHTEINFMFVVSFVTPTEANEIISIKFPQYLVALKEEVTRLFAREQISQLTPEECAQAYVTLLDGLDVQLVYENPDAYDKTLKISWRVFSHGIQGS